MIAVYDELAETYDYVVELREPQSLYRLHGANTHMRLSLEEVLRRDRADDARPGRLERRGDRTWRYG